MNLAGNLSLILNHIPAVFPRQTEPAIAVTDFCLNQQHANTADQQGLKADPQAKCTYVDPWWVPHDQVFSEPYAHSGLPRVEYDLVETSNDVSLSAWKAEPWGFYELELLHTAEDLVELTAWANLSAPVDTQGVIFLWKRRVKDASHTTSLLAFRVHIRDGDPEDGGTEYIFSVSTGIGMVPQLGLSTDGGETWKVINSWLKEDGGAAAFIGNTSDRYEQVEVLFVNFQLQFFLGGSTTPFVVPLDWQSDYAPVISRITFKANHFKQLNLSVHPKKWSTTGENLSGNRNMGSAPVNAPSYRIHGLRTAVTRASGAAWEVDWPPGSEITVTRPLAVPFNSVNQQYQLRIQNAAAGTYAGRDYADYTAAVTRVAVRMTGVWVGTNPAWNQPEELAAYGKGLKEVREDISLDLNSLTIHHRVSFVLDNFYGGSGLNGDRSGLQGNKAVSLQFGYLNPAVPLQQRFVGIAQRYEYCRPSNAQAQVRVYCVDQMAQLAGKYNFSPPDLDGWNHYAAIAYLAQLAGIHASQFSPFLRHRVGTESGGTLWTDPNGVIDPFVSTASDTSPYFLPLGIGMNPWTPRNRALSVLALMNHVRSATGYMLFFDAGGFLRYEPWIPPSVGAIKKTFTEGPSGPDGGNLSEFWDPVVVSDTSEVRNQVVVLGVDAFGGSWAPVVVKQEDQDSITNPLAPNYVSWESPFVWADSKFANLGFAAEAAQRVLAFMRVPEYSENHECWLQPTLFPMDTIALAEAKSGIASLPLYITHMTNLYSCLGGAIRMRSQITGRYLTPFVA